MDNIIVTETGNPEFNLRLDVVLEGVAKTFFGKGLVGCPEGAGWWCPLTGNEVSDLVRTPLLAWSEARIAAERLVVLQALLAGG